MVTLDTILPHSTYCDDWHSPEYDCVDCKLEAATKQAIEAYIAEKTDKAWAEGHKKGYQTGVSEE